LKPATLDLKYNGPELTVQVGLAFAAPISIPSELVCQYHDSQVAAGVFLVIVALPQPGTLLDTEGVVGSLNVMVIDLVEALPQLVFALTV
jgi:hypothetical protein